MVSPQLQEELPSSLPEFIEGLSGSHTVLTSEQELDTISLANMLQTSVSFNEHDIDEENIWNKDHKDLWSF